MKNFRDTLIFGDDGKKYKKMVDKGYFDTYYNVFVLSAIIGFLKREYKQIEKDDDFITIPMKVFINNNRIYDQIFDSIALLHLSYLCEDDPVKKLIDDYYVDQEGKPIVQSICECYAACGINYLYDEIIGNSEDFMINIERIAKFIEEFSEKYKLIDLDALEIEDIIV